MERDEERLEGESGSGKRPAAAEGYVSFGTDDGPGTADGAARPRRRGVVAGVAAVACLVLVIGCAGFIHPGPDGSWSLAWLAPGQEAAAPAGSSEGDAGTGQPAEAEEDASDDASDVAADQGDAAAGESDGPVRSDAAAEGAAPTGAASAGQASQAGDQAPAPSGGAAPESDPEPARIAVSVSVDSSSVGNPVSASATVELEQGATAYDALRALGLSVNASSSQFGVYVAGIGGLAEKEHGGTSGWVYTLNGGRVNVSASSCKLSDGDVVRWSYVTEAS